MNKKERNRKTVTQNRRNRILNKRYSSTVRGLAKLYVAKFENFKYISKRAENLQKHAKIQQKSDKMEPKWDPKLARETPGART